MNKKFLSVVLFGALMAGSSVTFTGCIDNDEPAGIENLRGAKAELLRAKVAVETAEAALRNAYAAEHLAQAKWTEAMAAKQELENEEKRLKNEVEAAKTEAEKAYWAAELAKIEADLAKNKLTWEADRLAAETVLAQARKDYEDAMKAIELSKNYLSEAELGQLNYVQGEYSYAYAKLYGGSYTRYTASVDKTTGKVTWSPKDDKVDKENSAKGILEAAYDTYESDVNAGNFENISEIKLNAAVAEAKTTLEVTVAELGIKKEALAALESSETLANWKKVKAEYKAKQDSLNDVVADKTIAANKIVIENSDKAMAMQKALDNAAAFKTNTFKDGKIVQSAEDNAVIKASDALKEKLSALDFAKAGSYVTYDNSANQFTVALDKSNLLGVVRDNKDNGTVTLEKAKLDAEKDGVAPYEYWNTEGVKLLDDAIVFNGSQGTEYAKMNEAIDVVIETLNKAKGDIPSLDIEQANKELAAAKENLTAMEKAKTGATKTWKDAVTAWGKAKAYATETADKKAVETAADVYVKAIAAADALSGTEKVKAQIKARQAFADAVVTYYNAVNAGPGLTSNTVTLELNKAVGIGTEFITKSVQAWLSDANNKDSYLEALITYFGLTESTVTKDKLNVFWTEGTAETVIPGEQPSVKADAALKKINTVDDVRSVLLDASEALYGDVETLGYYTVNGTKYGRETEPSDAEIKAQWEKTPERVGACGKVLSAEKRVKTAEESVAQVDQFAAVVKALEEVKATIAAAKVDFMAEAKELIDAASAAQKECADNINAPIQELGIEADLALSEKIGNVIDAVEGSVGGFDTDWADEELLKQTEKYIALIGNLKDEIKTLQETTIPAAESALIKAEAMLDAYKNGNMSAQHVIEWAQAKVDNAKANYEAAVKELTYWTDKVQEVTAALYSKVAE